eukprot:CAMPEP_0195568770 /NCGR_PEP_ID=MMETSP0814-20130614/2437_1 /TAXON_ID=97485 /ORGANISM="Prymnesium parvum, Strain Texoma1" /LENGTH=140 /DNA_ID=CAMNT_0040704101 /DNA_START=255 /DNA_END=674 /DNA_ORIENTATION=+
MESSTARALHRIDSTHHRRLLTPPLRAAIPAFGWPPFPTPPGPSLATAPSRVVEPPEDCLLCAARRRAALPPPCGDDFTSAAAAAAGLPAEGFLGFACIHRMKPSEDASLGYSSSSPFGSSTSMSATSSALSPPSASPPR